MLETTQPFRFFDYFRVPYRVSARASNGAGALREQSPLRKCACVFADHAGLTRTLYWPAAVLDSTGRPSSSQGSRHELGDVPIFGHVIPDSVVEEWLSSTTTTWSRSTPIRNGDGAWVASVWRSDNGDILLPFDPDEVMANYWTENYLTLGRPALSRAARVVAVRGYYLARPLIPRRHQLRLRRAFARAQSRTAFPAWPIENALHDFCDWVLNTVSELVDGELPWLAPWPKGRSWAFVLTHDVETSIGFANMARLRDVERELGYLSSWNLVPRRYAISTKDVTRLVDEGCEIGVHGLYHDGHDVTSRRTVNRRLPHMRAFAEQWGAIGFRAPATHRVWELMPLLGFDYDSSYPDTDPYEPYPGGCCSFLPFRNRSVIELPITLPQDHTLFEILEHCDGRVWLDKTAHIRSRGGMVLALSHPDYAENHGIIDAYRQLLETYASDSTMWHALPREVNAWWRRREQTRIVPARDGWHIVGPAKDDASINVARPARGTVRS